MTFPHQLFDMSGKVTAITGGARGIGAQTARTLAAAGSAIAVLDVLTEPGEKLVAEINESGGRAAFWKMDVTQEENVQRVFGEIATRFGRLDALVNNAGIEGANLPTHEMTLQQWQKVIDVNVTGVFLCTKYAIPHMLTAGGGSIVNFGSVSWMVGQGGMPAYTAAKSAVLGLTRGLARDLGPFNIRVNSISPLAVDTPQLRESFAF